MSRGLMCYAPFSLYMPCRFVDIYGSVKGSVLCQIDFPTTKQDVHEHVYNLAFDKGFHGHSHTGAVWRHRFLSKDLYLMLLVVSDVSSK